ncbi:MAG: hypothetical protein EOP04_03810 [Proteobacteria bacterium]|nr:MAG: hypothetical protein EOP04_03810 [Pseudomonadota bacterium]
MKLILVPFFLLVACSIESVSNDHLSSISTLDSNTKKIPFDLLTIATLDVSGAKALHYLGKPSDASSDVILPTRGLYKLLENGEFELLSARSRSGELMDTSDMNVSEISYPNPETILLSLSVATDNGVQTQKMLITRETGNVEIAP